MYSESEIEKIVRNPSSKWRLMILIRDPAFFACAFSAFSLWLLYDFSSALLNRGICPSFNWICIVLLWVYIIPFFRNGCDIGKNRLYSREAKGETFVVTGGSKGLGFETVKHLYNSGAVVIVGSRSKDVLCSMLESSIDKPLEKGRLISEYLDLEDVDSIREFAETVNRYEINCLINNAGVLSGELNYAKNFPEKIEIQMATNHLAHFLLTKLLFKNIERNNGRIVNVSSIAHATIVGVDWKSYDEYPPSNYSNWSSYSNSKLANIWFTKELQRRLFQGKSTVSVYCCHPGCVKTELGRNLEKSFYRFFRRIINFVMMKDTLVGAYSQLFLALNPKHNLVPGGYYADCVLGFVMEHANDPVSAKEFWEWTEKKLNTKFALN